MDANSHSLSILAAVYGIVMLWIGYRLHAARVDGPAYSPVLWVVVGLAGLWLVWELATYIVGMR